MVLFNNKDIIIDVKPFLINEWYEEGIRSIHDTLDDNGKFLSFENFSQRYEVKCNF